MRRCIVYLCIALVVCSSVVDTVEAEGTNSFLGLWGKILQERERASKNETIASSSSSNSSTPLVITSNDVNNNTNSTAYSASSNQSFHSRLFQRLHDTYLDRKSPSHTSSSQNNNNNKVVWNATESLAELSSIVDKLGDPSSWQSLIPSTLQLNSTSSISNIFDQMHERLAQIMPENIDATQIAVLAILQGLLLRSLSQNDGSMPLQGPLNAHHFGMALPSATADRFDAQICMRFQNFGNGDGYRAACVGDCPCMKATDKTGKKNTASSTSLLSWGSEISFSLQCSGVSSESIVGSLISDPKCIASITTGNEPGSLHSGMILQYNAKKPDLRTPKLSHMRIKICNIPPSTGQFPAFLHFSGSTVNLHDVKLNGRDISGLKNTLAVSHQSSPDNCQSVFLKFPHRALAKDFVLTGSISLNNGRGPWGIGDMAFVDVQIGGIRGLLSAGSGGGGGIGDI